MSSTTKVCLTVFTPTYNRAYLLPRLYYSLCAQSCKAFVWLVVDDGSIDGTRELIRAWQRENRDFEIRYLYQKNGGMHTAHNTAYAAIDTELNICIDSDDCLADNAVQMILNKWDSVKKQGYAGLVGLDADRNTGEIIGSGFPNGMTETTLSGYYAAGGNGDKKLVYRTDVVNQYPPYPVFSEEKYVALAYKYLLIDQDYKLAVLNEVLCNVEYQSDGSSNNMLRQYRANPKGFAFWRIVRMQHPETMKRTIMDCIHYCSSSILAKNRKYVSESPQKLLTVLCTPLGLVLTGWVLWKTK